MIVSIHAGHGGADRGTSAGGIDEATYNLAFSASLCAMVQKLFYPLVKPILVRDTDELVPLSAAGDFAADQKAALAFAVHCNAHTSSQAHGLRIFSDAAFPAVEVCADEIFRTYPLELTRSGSPKRLSRTFKIDPVKRAAGPWLRRPWNVISPYSRRGVPCLLLELFFASNPRDLSLAQDEWVRSQMLMAVCHGVASYARAFTADPLFPSALQ